MNHPTIKWLVVANEIRLGTVDYHKFLLKCDEDKDVKISGGGMVWIIRDTEQIVFFGRSEDFGAISSKEEFFRIFEEQKSEVIYQLERLGELFWGGDQNYVDYEIKFIEDK